MLLLVNSASKEYPVLCHYSAARDRRMRTGVGGFNRAENSVQPSAVGGVAAHCARLDLCAWTVDTGLLCRNDLESGAKPSSCFAVVVLEHPAETLTASNGTLATLPWCTSRSRSRIGLSHRIRGPR